MLAFFISFLIAFILAPPTIYLAKKLNLITDKNKRYHPAHTHTGIIPRGGGIPIYISIFISSLLFLEINKIIIGVLISSFLMFILGLIDDYQDTSPILRFFANFFIAIFLICFGLGIPYISNPFGGIIRLDLIQIKFNFFGERNFLVIANILSVIWLVWTTNMINWSKGVDGQLPGFVSITAFFLGLLSSRFVAHDISVNNVVNFAFIVSGAYLGFLPYNFYPQKIMPGYSGGALAGFLLGILSILSFGKLGTAILILAIPLIDAIYTIIRRIKNKKSIFKADWGHFHHRLLEIGWGKRRIAIFYWLISFILGLTSLFLKGIEKLIAFITIAILLLIFILIIEKTKKNFKVPIN